MCHIENEKKKQKKRLTFIFISYARRIEFRDFEIWLDRQDR